VLTAAVCKKLIDMNDCVHNQSDGQQHFYLT